MNDVVNNSNEEAVSEEAPPKKKAKPNPFLTTLRDNQVEQFKAALMKTICSDPGQTFGTIIDALENDSDGDYIMLDTFKRLTIEELVLAAGSYLSPAALPPASAPVADDDDDDDLDDDDEFEDDGSLDDEGDDGEADKKAKAKAKKKAKKAPPKKSPKKDKAKGKSKPSNDDLLDKDYQKAIVGLLKEQKARDEDSALSGEHIRKGNEDFEGIGGDADKLRANMDVLREKEKVDKAGKARGTKYFRLRKKK
jgi:hypothetical protein